MVQDNPNHCPCCKGCIRLFEMFLKQHPYLKVTQTISKMRLGQLHCCWYTEMV